MKTLYFIVYIQAEGMYQQPVIPFVVLYDEYLQGSFSHMLLLFPLVFPSACKLVNSQQGTRLLS
jgi:hypothetical protein